MKSKELKKLSGKEIEFSADDLLKSLRGHAEHLEGKKKVTMKISRLLMRASVKVIKPRDIKAIRVKLNVSQPVFASLLNVPVTTARSWEQGKRKPSGAALKLLDLARRRPEILLAA